MNLIFCTLLLSWNKTTKIDHTFSLFLWFWENEKSFTERFDDKVMTIEKCKIALTTAWCAVHTHSQMRGACVLIINIQVYVNVQNTLFFYAKIFVGYFFSFCCLNRSQWNSRELRVFSNGHTNSSSRNIIIIIECERKKRRKHVENVKRNNPKKTIWTNKMNEWDGRTKRRMCTMWMVSWHLKIVLDWHCHFNSCV